MTNKFTAVYTINKFKDGDEDFGHELLDLQVLFESPYEEASTIGEYSPTYDHVIHNILKPSPEGLYSVYVVGYLVYTKDYYGECDVEDEIEYASVIVLPPEMSVCYEEER